MASKFDYNAKCIQDLRRWIQGPVLCVATVPGSADVVIVAQGSDAYSVVNHRTREFFACCPTVRAARKAGAAVVARASQATPAGGAL